ncbi:MAG: NusG domain II-containing protein [Gammaproteobacteria bacterium]|jgi:hypothetical protein
MTRADRILILLAVCAMPFLYLHLWFHDEPANFVQILNGSSAAVTESLQPDRILSAVGRLGASIIEVRNNRVRFVSSPCIKQVCVHSGWLTNAGEFASCLPNQISLTLTGHDPRFDAINF